MPQRFLRPGIRNSSRWNSVSRNAQALYIGLLTLVDDYGQYDGRVSVLWAECFIIWNELNPKAAVSLAATRCALQQLADTKLIEVFEGNTGKRYVQITQWSERVREGCKPKWRESGVDYVELQQVAASCSKILPPTPSPTPASIAHASVQRPSPTPSDNGTASPLPQKRFSIPSIDEVKLLAVKAGLPENEAVKFWNYYDSKGWKVGKVPMVSLNGAIGGWTARWRESNPKPIAADHSKGF